jgi:8-oxo-dGTP pyrophosphatase MutT (NUDIX family)
VIRRAGARVLLIDGHNRVLLLHGHDPATPDLPYWFTVGGGLDVGEDVRAAAVRELCEETGLRVEPGALIGPVHHDVAEFPFDGQWYRQEQDYFWLRVAEWTVDTSGFEPIEQATVDAWRWWSAEELRATGERWFPAELPDLLDQLGAGPSVDSTCV